MKKVTGEGAVIRYLVFGLIGFFLLLGFYFTVLTLVSGWEFTLEKFDDNWYYVLGLSAGFGIQIGLYSRLKMLKPIRQAQGGQVQYDKSGKVVAVSGTTSTASMIACCSHYLVNVLPVIGVTGLVVFVAQYQTQLFWVGILANLIGILYMVRKVFRSGRG